MEKEKQTKEKKEKVFEGVVVSTGMKNTLGVRVERYIKHPKYRKFVKRRKTYAVHIDGGTYKVGDRVKFQETKPISKTKKFIVVA